MGIQIFGTNKCFDTKKAQRFFKERRVSVQFIDLREKEMSRGELQSVIQSVHGIEQVLDPACRDQDALALIQYIVPEAKLEKLLENQQCLKTPIVRNGKLATVGYQPDVWTAWLSQK